MVMDISKMWEAAADSAFNGKACVVGGISAGMAKKSGLEKKGELVSRAEMLKLRQEAAEARGMLVRARAKPLSRIKGWAGIHGRGVSALTAT